MAVAGAGLGKGGFPIGPRGAEGANESLLEGSGGRKPVTGPDTEERVEVCGLSANGFCCIATLSTDAVRCPPTVELGGTKDIGFGGMAGAPLGFVGVAEFS